MPEFSPLFANSLSHKTSRVEEREAILFALDPSLPNQYTLQTCNRVEQYVWNAHSTNAFERDYALKGVDAARHLLRVAAGLESLVLGEAQILGQIKTTAEQTQLPPALKKLIQAAIRTGKRARTETDINKHNASIGSVSLKLAERRLGTLQDKDIAVIGLGDIGQITLKACHHRGLDDLMLINRTLGKAEVLASTYNGRPADLAAIPEALATADLIFCATSAPGYILSMDDPAHRKAIEQRKGRPLLLVDLAVPRDIDPAFEAIPGIERVDIDSLNADLDEARTARERAIPQVEAIIEEELEILRADLRELELQPVIKELRQQAESIRQAELDRLKKYLGEDLDPAVMAHLDKFSNALVNKLLHAPMRSLRNVAHNGAVEVEVYTHAVRKLFELESEHPHA